MLGAAAVFVCCGVHAVEIAYENRIDLSGVWNLEQVGKKEVNHGSPICALKHALDVFFLEAMELH